MATSFPTGLDALTNPTSADTLASPDHAAQHANVNDAVEAIEAQIGTTASPVLARLASPTFTGTVTAPTFSGALSGNASTATTVTTNANLTGHITSTGNAAVLGSFTSAQLASALTDETGTGANVFAGSPTLTGTVTAAALTVTNATTSGSYLQGTDYLSPYQGFRNKIINGDFCINQRAFSSTTTIATYGFDRWCLDYSTGTSTYSAQTFTTGSPAATGFESANFARIVSSGQTATSAYTILFQRIEDVRTFANSTVTISFWAKATSGTPKVAVELQQNFGSGGSPSSQVNNYAGQVTLSTSWARHSVTFAVPNINGKTIGTTAGTSFIGLNLWTSSGSDYNSRTGSIGIQSTTIDFWGVQVERGSVATPFEQRPIGVELDLCQRYFYKNTKGMLTCRSGGFGNSYASQIFFPIEMRAAPTITMYSQENFAGTAGQATWYQSAIGSAAGFSVEVANTLGYGFYRTGNALSELVIFSYKAEAEL